MSAMPQICRCTVAVLLYTVMQWLDLIFIGIFYGRYLGDKMCSGGGEEYCCMWGMFWCIGHESSAGCARDSDPERVTKSVPYNCKTRIRGVVTGLGLLCVTFFFPFLFISACLDDASVWAHSRIFLRSVRHRPYLIFIDIFLWPVSGRRNVYMDGLRLKWNGECYCNVYDTIYQWDVPMILLSNA